MNFEEMKALPKSEQDKIYKRIKSSRKPLKVVNYCLPMRTKVLTKSGWKTFDEISVGEVIPSYNRFSDRVEDSVVEAKHFYENSEVVRVKNSNTDFVCTPNHRWFSQRKINLKDARGYYKLDFVETKDICHDDNILLSSRYVGGDGGVTPNDAFLMGLILSDGYIKWSPESSGPSTAGGKRRGVLMSVAQSKNKFWEKVEKALNNCGVSYVKDVREVENGNDVYIYRIPASDARNFLDRVVGERVNPQDYNWTSWVMDLKRQSLESFYYGFYLGDGTMAGKRICISQNTGAVFDAIVAASQLLGWGRVTVLGSDKCRDINILATDRLTGQKLKIEPNGSEDVFCLTTSTGTFIIWQDDFIGITGNSCQYSVGAKTLARNSNMTVSEAQGLIDAYWDMNWAVKKVADEQHIKKLKDGSMWLKNPINGFYYSLRYEKDIFSTLVQGSGDFIFSLWAKFCVEAGLDLKINYHDEWLTEVPIGEEGRVEEIAHQSMKKVNDLLKLNKEIKVDVQFGDNYAEVH